MTQVSNHSLVYNVSKIYNDGKSKIDIKIRLNDECKNGHIDFAITANCYELNKYDHWFNTCGGCCHEEILEACPEFRPFVDLHLCLLVDGSPFYAIENGIYHIKDGNWDAIRNHFRLSYSELVQMKADKGVSDPLYLRWYLHANGIFKRWKQEAEDAKRMLEELCGQTIEDNSVKRGYEPLTEEEIEKVNDLIKSGYYDNSAVEKRQEDAFKAELEKARQEKIESFEKKVAQMRQELDVELYFLSLGVKTDNYIYYSHRNTVVFNWKEWGDKMSQEEFVDMINKVDYTKLPEGIEIELGDKGRDTHARKTML